MGDSLCPQGIKKGFSEEVTFEGRVVLQGVRQEGAAQEKRAPMCRDPPFPSRVGTPWRDCVSSIRL